MSDSQPKNTDELIYRAENDPNAYTIFPARDTITEHNVHVVRNKSTPNFKHEQDSQEERHIRVFSHKQTDSSITHEGQNVPKLEGVVITAIDLCTPEKVIETQHISQIAEETQKTQESNDKHNVKEIDDINDIEKHIEVGEQDTEKDSDPEEAVSPSQSENNRATRWEALADIAAELPPSLTVDPITGQIYAVSK